jgi:apolipoprotein D and lipocalin family protein
MSRDSLLTAELAPDRAAPGMLGLAERGWLPDRVIRQVVRLMCVRRLRQERLGRLEQATTRAREFIAWRWMVGLVMLLCGCADHEKPTIPPVSQVDLARFMGDWFVIATIPTRAEREAYDEVESYALRADGRIQTTFRYRNKSFSAPVKTMKPVGTVKPGTGNAVWGMQFIWPITAEYVIVYLSEDYSQTIIGRSSRDYAWVMARTPALSDADYARNVQRLSALGYDVSKVRRVPQR